VSATELRKYDRNEPDGIAALAEVAVRCGHVVRLLTQEALTLETLDAAISALLAARKFAERRAS
jgi:hypothetical protein